MELSSLQPRVMYEELLEARAEHQALDGEWVLHAIGGFKPKVAIDLGCGPGAHLSQLQEQTGALVIGIEVDAKSLHKAKPMRKNGRVVLQLAEAEKLPFRDATIDLALVSRVMQVPQIDPTAVARTLKRVIRPGGLLIVRQRFRGRTHGDAYAQILPKIAMQAMGKRLPSIKEEVALFGAHGFDLRRHTIHHLAESRSMVEVVSNFQRLNLAPELMLALTAAARERDDSRLDTRVFAEYDVLVFKRSANA